MIIKSVLILCALGGLCGGGRLQAQATTTTTATTVATSPTVININTASSTELERLPGIGPARARAILALRTRLGRFARVEDLLRVRGIGRATFRRLRPYLTLEGQTTLGVDPAPT